MEFFTLKYNTKQYKPKPNKMRKLTLLICLLPTLCVGQISITENTTKTIEIGKYKYSDYNKGSLKYSVTEGDTLIMFVCLDQKYQSLQSYKVLSFRGGAKDKDQLYDALMTFYSEENKDNKDYKLDIILGNKDVYVFKSGKLVNMSFENSRYSFTKDNLTTLFGKRE